MILDPSGGRLVLSTWVEDGEVSEGTMKSEGQSRATLDLQGSL